eukprot:4478138-Pleurochrysis_carterae.AAC.1
MSGLGKTMQARGAAAQAIKPTRQTCPLVRGEKQPAKFEDGRRWEPKTRFGRGADSASDAEPYGRGARGATCLVEPPERRLPGS